MNSFFYSKFRSIEGAKNQEKYNNLLIELINNLLYTAENYQSLIYDQTLYLLNDIDSKFNLCSISILTTLISVYLTVLLGFQAFDRKIIF
jgi:hypothetical protein